MRGGLKAIAITIVLLLLTRRQSEAIFALEGTQILNKIQLIAIEIQNIRMYADMVRNSGKFNSLAWAQIERHLADFEKALRVGQSIAWQIANVEAQLRQRYPGYGRIPIPIYMQYKDWSKTSFDTLAGVLVAAAEHRRKMADELSVIKDLRSDLMSADGRLKAQQIQASASLETAQQLVELRELLRSQIASDVAYRAHMLQVQAADTAAIEKLFSWTPHAGGNKKFRFD